MSVKVSIESNSNKKTTDWLKNLIKKQSGVKVGFFQGNYYSNGESVAAVAIQNEFGGLYPTTEDYRKRGAAKGINVPDMLEIPPRPFMHQTIQNHKKEWAPLLNALLKKNGGDLDGAFNSLGAVIKGQVVDTIYNGEFEPDSAPTIIIKESDQPLVDSSHMAKSVSWAIIEGNKK